MPKGELIDSHVPLQQCKKAVDALHSHELKKKEKFEEGQLLPAKEQNIWLNVVVKAIPSGHKLKPVKIPIVHPLVDPRTSAVCLITKDPQREYKDLLEKHNIKFISRVVGIEKLKGKFKPFEARRMLLKENGMFLADERVIPLLPKLLGSKWFEAKKQPIPVCLTRKDLKGELERAISSTYMNQNQGTYTSIKIGKMSQKPSQILDNLKTALPSVVKALKGGWDNVQSLSIKTNYSVSLPIWSCSLDSTEGGRWDGFQVESDSEEDEQDEASEEEEEKEVEAPKAKKDVAGKGRKRASSSDEEQEEEEKPKKKAKSADGAPSTKAKSAPTSKPTKMPPTTIDTASKKRKTTDPTLPAPTASPSAVPISAGKKAPKAKASSATTSSEPTIVSPAPKAQKIPESDTKKVKKSQAAATPAIASQSSLPATSEVPSKKKKSNKLDISTASSDPSQSPSAPDTATPSAGKDKSGKDKKKLSKSAPVSAPVSASESPAKPTLTKEELKQKRGAASGEKKKDIIAKAKGGKSAKNAVLGRKVAQE
ncbi:Putative ribosome biogenesis protein C8F11.04 [Psilocybe cubensis]|uniref:Ribosome biogenesis protein C8F11.04 n=2 Tax=Psilocybe cubensis TaxID=181762 RepID=A0ACB8GWV8_PSICU|nr:Putative ribosome biogenesis protein C8F11.04 [Psilocybe cubensis]KAH9480228.1 Putative ribosome biogenesis protein C8F11.04 [Psilocybe cubensis]